MMLAEEDPLEAERFVLHPEIEIAREISRHVLRIGVVIGAAQFGKKFKEPWLDHSSLSVSHLLAAFCASAAARLCSVRMNCARWAPTIRSTSRSCAMALAISLTRAASPFAVSVSA